MADVTVLTLPPGIKTCELMSLAMLESQPLPPCRQKLRCEYLLHLEPP